MEDQLARVLDRDEVLAWVAYEAHERDGRRHQALVILEHVVQRLLTYPAARRDQVAELVCRLVVDQGVDLPVRHPLLVKVLFPYLARMYERGFQHAPRWLAHFHDALARAREGREWLVVRHLHREQLLSEALERDPSDAAVRHALIESMARGFAYAVHEVPAGVLYDSHGASIAECQELLADLRRFGELVDAHGERPTYATAMREWEYQFKAYADYVAQRERYTSYAHYLELHGWPGRDGPT